MNASDLGATTGEVVSHANGPGSGLPARATPATGVRSVAAHVRHPWTGLRAIDLAVHIPRGDVSEPDLEAGVAIINHAMGEVGMLSQVGGSLDWLMNRRMRRVHISLVTRDGQTTIAAHEALAPLAGVVYGGIVAGVGLFGIGWVGFILGLHAFHSVPIALGAWSGLVAVTCAAARWTYARVVARRVRQLDSLLDQLRGRLKGDGLPDP